ncbi:MAG: hypothetical protein GXO10_06640 [Crenarchaeota archaeon]|nr:hypothetical protein [Thermoproteota archaeon]
MPNIESIAAKWHKRADWAAKKAQTWTEKAANHTKAGETIRAKLCTAVAALYKKLEAIAKAVSNKLDTYVAKYKEAKAKAAQEKEKAKQLKEEAKQKKQQAKQEAKNANKEQAANIEKQADEVTDNIIKQADAHLADVKKMNDDLDFIIKKVENMDEMSEQDWDEVNKRLDNMIHETQIPNRGEIANVVGKALKEGKRLEL